MRFFPNWYENPNSLNPDKDEDLVQALDAISVCVGIVRTLMNYDEESFDGVALAKEFAQLQRIFKPTTELISRMNWELDPVTARRGIAEVGCATGGNHLWAAR